MFKNLILIFFSLVAFIAIFAFAKITLPGWTKDKVNQAKKSHRVERTFDKEVIGFDLLDPEMAPKEIREDVMRGYEIILHTNKLLPQYVDDRLTCANCHISAGNTLGGKRGGISLVAVDRVYPRFSLRIGKVIDLVDRVNNCFERSMNGKALPRDSKEMKAIIAYLTWIGSKIPERNHYPWLGLERLTTTHLPNAENGAKIYQQHCVYCHQANGQGTVNYPPLWGPHAFNDGAGMSTLSKMSSFIFYNMPQNDPFLTQEQAIDVAAFLVNQRRPTYIQNTPENKP